MNGVPRNRYFWFFSIAVVGAAVDLWTKAWVFSWPQPGPGPRHEWWLIENFVGIQLAVNQGALFGFGQGFAPLFALTAVVAAVGIVAWLFWAGAARDLTLTLALASVTGGIFGNLYDRLGLHGLKNAEGQPLLAVRDWILFCYYDKIWPNFNVADCLLVCGSILLAIQAIRFREPPTEN